MVPLFGNKEKKTPDRIRGLGASVLRFWKGSTNVSKMESSWRFQHGIRYAGQPPPTTGRHTLEVMVPHRIFPLTHSQPWHSFTSARIPPPPPWPQHLTLHEEPTHPSTPPATKNAFPFVSRIAECCWLLFTEKFAEAVSCPPTSAPRSEEGEERRGHHIRVVHATYVSCTLWVKTHTHTVTHMSKLLFKSVLCILLNALLAAPRKQNTHLCNCTQSKQGQAHAKTGARHFNFLHAPSVW